MDSKFLRRLFDGITEHDSISVYKSPFPTPLNVHPAALESNHAYLAKVFLKFYGDFAGFGTVIPKNTSPSPYFPLPVLKNL